MSTWLTDRSTFESLFSASPNGIAALDAAGRIVDCNPACTLLSGYKRQDLTGRDIREMAGPGLRAFIDEAFEAAKAGKSLRRELDLKRVDGSLLQGEVTSIPVMDSSSEVKLFLVVQDITGRFTAEQSVLGLQRDLTRAGDEIEHLRHNFDLLFEHNPSVVVAIDLEHRITGVNPAGVRISGFTVEEMTGRDVHEFVPPSQRDRLRTFLSQVARGETVTFSIDAYSADGRVIEYEATLLPIVSNRRVVGAYGLLENITERMRAERTIVAQREELLDLEHDFRSIFERNPDGMALLSTDGAILDLNESLVRLSRRSREEVAGQSFRTFLQGDDLERGWSFFRRAVEGEAVRFEISSMRGDGEPAVLDATLFPKYVQGLIVGIYCVVKDITERKTALRKLEMQTQRMRDLYLLATTAEYTDAQVMSTLQTGCRLLGMESGAIIDTTRDARVDMRYDALELFAGDDDALLQLARDVLQKREAVVSESGDGDTGGYGSWIASRLVVAGQLQGVLLFFSHTRRDQPFEEIDHDTLALMSALVGAALERRRTRSHLRTLAYYDALTGLPNRLLFQERLRDALVDSRGHASGLAVLFFDLDSFKDINDSLGHAMGDRFLQMVANRLARAVGEAGLVARMGGDEFIVLVRDCQSMEQVKALAERLLHAIDQPYKLDGYEQFMTTSIGVSIYPSDGRDDQTLIKNADIAMYQAKDRGGNRYVLYNESFEAPLRTRLTQEKELRRAIERQHFVLHFQPIIDVATEKIVSVEALVRWNHPQRGMIFPDAFIPTAEASGLIVQLGEWVIASAARQVAAWNDVPEGVCLAINISARQFHQPDLCERLLELLRESGLSPQSVELEITESMALSDIAHAIETVRRLKAIGARIAVDDFGTGHSSLNYLRRFDVDHIKIDRSFVAGIGNELSDETIVKAIIAMGHSLGLTIVAEGVETRAQYDFLRAHGCDRVQGYYFSRPLDAVGLEQLLRGRGTPGEAG